MIDLSHVEAVEDRNHHVPTGTSNGEVSRIFTVDEVTVANCDDVATNLLMKGMMKKDWCSDNSVEFCFRHEDQGRNAGHLHMML